MRRRAVVSVAVPDALFCARFSAVSRICAHPAVSVGSAHPVFLYVLCYAVLGFIVALYATCCYFRTRLKSGILKLLPKQQCPPTAALFLELLFLFLTFSVIQLRCCLSPVPALLLGRNLVGRSGRPKRRAVCCPGFDSRCLTRVSHASDVLLC